jgi:hypothetical protein
VDVILEGKGKEKNVREVRQLARCRHFDRGTTSQSRTLRLVLPAPGNCARNNTRNGTFARNDTRNGNFTCNYDAHGACYSTPATVPATKSALVQCLLSFFFEDVVCFVVTGTKQNLCSGTSASTAERAGDVIASIAVAFILSADVNPQ